MLFSQSWKVLVGDSCYREATESAPKEEEKIIPEADDKGTAVDELTQGGASAEDSVEKGDEDNVRSFIH
jgi:hypothetical protein